jgi:Acetyltransferases, including N-acetylases of ribosomal proteins
MAKLANPRIEISDGFYLSRIGRTDKAAYMEHLVDPEIARNTLAIPFPYTEADADSWLDLCEKQACEPEKLFAIREPGGSLIGSIGIVGDAPPSAKAAEFGYWLAKPYRRRGLMPRVIDGFVKYVFRHLALRRLYASPFVSNVPSQRVLEKAGFQRQTLVLQRYLKNGVFVDAVLYAREAENKGDT